MRIGTDDKSAGQGKALFGQHLMTNAALDVIEIFNALLFDKRADVFVILREFVVGSGYAVVENNDMPFRIVNGRHADLFKGLGNGRGVVVAHGHVRIDFDDFTRRHFFTGLLTENFFCKSLAHRQNAPFQFPDKN